MSRNRDETGWRLILLNIALGLGTFIQVLDISIANVSIPYIAGNLSVSNNQGTWVITSFAASNAIVLPLTGWLSNYFGSVRLFVRSILLFALTSFLCGLAPNFTILVALRTIQGAVAGSLIPLSLSLIINHNPSEQRGVALGFWGMIVVVAPILGPIIGGYLTDVYSWPWIFYINVPIGLFSASVTWLILKDRESKIIRNPIDWIGLALLSFGVACLQIMLDKGKDLNWVESNVINSLFICSIISLIYFGVWNHYQKYSIIDFSFFRNWNFALGTFCATLGYMVYFGSTVTIPLWLQTEQGYTAYWAGIAVAPIGFAPLVLSPLVGKYMYRIDMRWLPVCSFFIFSFTFFYQSYFTTQVDLFTIMFTRFMQGFAVSLFFLPLVQLSLGEVPRGRYASASGLFNFIRILVGSGFGTSLAIEFWTRFKIFHHQRLGELIIPSRSVINEFYQRLDHYHPAFTQEVSTRLLDQLIEQQAYMLATNDLLRLGSWLFLGMIPLLFFLKRVRPAHQAEAAH